jgi:hypothetical protein
VLAISVASILAPILSGGLGISLAYFGGRSGQSRAGLTEVSTIWLLALMSLFVASFAILFYQQQSTLISWVWQIAVAGAIFLICSGALRSIDNPTPFFLVSFLSPLLSLGFVLLFPILLGGSNLVFLGYAISSALAVVAVFAFHALPLKFHAARVHSLAQAIPASALLGVHQLMSVALLLGVRVIVGQVSGSEALAAFLFCSLLVGSGLTLSSTLDGYWSIESQKTHSLEQLRLKLQVVQLKIQCFLFVFGFLTAIFWLMFGSVWLPPGLNSSQIALAVGLGLPAWGLQALADGQTAKLIWEGKRSIVSFASAASVIFSFSLCFLLLPTFGIPAATFSLTIGMLTRLVILVSSDPKGRVKQLKSSYLAFLLTVALALIFVIR